MRRAITLLIVSALLVSAISLSASAQSQGVFYLHSGMLLDENAPSQEVANATELGGILHYFFWNTTAFSSERSFPAGTWSVDLWMNITTEPTQYRVTLRVNNQTGTFVELFYQYTPTISFPSPTQYQITKALSAFKINAGGSLALGLLRTWSNGTASHEAFIFFDSQVTPSSLTAPAVTTTTTTPTTTQTTTTQLTTQTTTTTQQTTTTTTQVEPGPGIGFAVALMGIGGAAAAGGGIAVAMSGRQYPQVFTYGGYYYCAKHQVPVWYMQGYFWCPVERRYLRP